MPTSFTLNASWIIIGIIVILVVILYNRLVKLKNNRENAFADIDVQLKLRFDLVENLVNTVKGYATHEQETFQKVIEARNSFAHAGSVDSKIAADNQLTGALKSIFALAESYPELKANENFLELQTELSDIENKLAAARRFFNNNAIQTFPSNFIAGMFGFKTEKSFELDDVSERKAPKVKF